MATRYYGANYSAANSADVTEAGSTTSSNVELAVVYDATGATQYGLLNALRAIMDKIKEDSWPPA